LDKVTNQKFFFSL